MASDRSQIVEAKNHLLPEDVKNRNWQQAEEIWQRHVQQEQVGWLQSQQPILQYNYDNGKISRNANELEEKKD